ncbi:unnamed protein product, partial [Urochloa humidicola]
REPRLPISLQVARPPSLEPLDRGAAAGARAPPPARVHGRASERASASRCLPRLSSAPAWAASKGAPPGGSAGVAGAPPGGPRAWGGRAPGVPREWVAGLHIVASAVPQPQTLRGRLLRGSSFQGGWLRAQAAVAGPPEVDDDDAMSIDNLHRFFDLNFGRWNGSFYQFDAHGRVLQDISTRLSVSTYGEDDLISLLQPEAI